MVHCEAKSQSRRDLVDGNVGIAFGTYHPRPCQPFDRFGRYRLFTFPVLHRISLCFSTGGADGTHRDRGRAAIGPRRFTKNNSHVVVTLALEYCGSHHLAWLRRPAIAFQMVIDSPDGTSITSSLAPEVNIRGNLTGKQLCRKIRNHAWKGQYRERGCQEKIVDSPFPFE